jgi:AraC-like DNA-binding protein
MAHAILGSLWMSIGFFAKAKKSFQKSLSLYNIFTDLWGRGQTLQWLGYSCEWEADYDNSIRYFIESYNIFKSIGDVREMGMCVAGKIHNFTYTSDYHSAAMALDEYLDISTKTGDDYGISESWTYRSRYFLETGDLDKAEECAFKAFNHSLEKNVMFTHCRASIELGYCFLEKNEIPRALHYLQHAKDLFDSGNFLRHYTVHLFYHMAEAMLFALTANSRNNSASNKKRLKEIKKIVSRALRESTRWRTHRPGALRSAALFSGIEGKTSKAERLYAAAIEEAKKIGRKYEQSLSMVQLSSLLLRHGKEKKALQLLTDALGLASQIGAEGIKKRIIGLLGFERCSEDSIAPLTHSISKEKLSAAIQLCDEIISSVDSDELMERLLENSLKLTNAQRAYLFILDRKSGTPILRASKNLAGSGLAEYSRNIVDEVIESGKSIVVSSACTDHSFRGHKSVLLGELKSVMCVPIRWNDLLVGVFYFDNPLSTGVFSNEEAKLLETLLSRVSEHLCAIFTFDNASDAFLPSVSQEEKISPILKYIEKNFASDITRESLAEEFNFNPDYLGKIFKSITGKKIGEYINELRIKRAAEKLSSTDALIIDIAYSVGFESLRTFNRAFKNETGFSPKEYREKYSMKK